MRPAVENALQTVQRKELEGSRMDESTLFHGCSFAAFGASDTSDGLSRFVDSPDILRAGMGSIIRTVWGYVGGIVYPTELADVLAAKDSRAF